MRPRHRQLRQTTINEGSIVQPDFVTRISKVEEGRVIIRGFSHEEIMRELSYGDATFLTLVGRLPTPAESKITNTILTSLLDHGFVAATISAARYIASGNPQFVPAVAGGLLAAGSNTLSPEHSYGLIRRALDLRDERGLEDDQAAELIVTEYRERRQRIPGFGHPIHRDGDFRATVIFEQVGQLGLEGPAQRIYRAIHAEFVRQTGKTNIPINIDGCLACVGMDLGLEVHQIVSLALLAVLPGLMAHVSEEIASSAPLRWIADGRYEVDEYRPLPQSLADSI